MYKCHFPKTHFSFPNIIPCVPSFSHVHAKFHVFLYSPINRADTYLRPLSLHTIKNYAKISCIGLFPYGLFSFLHFYIRRYFVMNLLNEDNVVHVFLNKLGDIVIANLLFILCCIPVITIGPSLTALYHCMMRTVKGNNNGTTKTFFRAFKENFKQSLIIWLLILAAGAVIILNIRFLLHAEGSAAHMLFYLSVGVLTLLIIFTLYIFPVIATFANTLGALCRNAFLLAFMHFPTTIAIAVITIFPLYMTYLDAKLQPLYACCWFFFGFGLVAFINSMLLYRFFKKLLPPEEDISLL